MDTSGSIKESGDIYGTIYRDFRPSACSTRHSRIVFRPLSNPITAGSSIYFTMDPDTYQRAMYKDKFTITS